MKHMAEIQERARKIVSIVINVVLVARPIKTFKHMNKSQSVKQNKKHLKPSTKAQDPSNVGYEEKRFKSKKKI